MGQFKPGDLVMFMPGTLLTLAKQQPATFDLLMSTNRVGGEVISATDNCVVVSIDHPNKDNLQIEFDAARPHLALQVIKAVDGRPVEQSLAVAGGADSETESLDADQDDDDEPDDGSILEPTISLIHVQPEYPLHQQAGIECGIMAMSPDMQQQLVALWNRTSIPVRIQTSQWVIIQFLQSKQHGVIHANRQAERNMPGDEWKEPPNQLVTMTKNEEALYNTALRKLKRWLKEPEPSALQQLSAPAGS